MLPRNQCPGWFAPTPSPTPQGLLVNNGCPLEGQNKIWISTPMHPSSWDYATHTCSGPQTTLEHTTRMSWLNNSPMLLNGWSHCNNAWNCVKMSVLCPFSLRFLHQVTGIHFVWSSCILMLTMSNYCPT